LNEGLIDLFADLMNVHLNRHFTVQYTYWVDGIWRENWGQYLYSVSSDWFKINKAN